MTERLIHKRIASYLRTAYPETRFYTTLDGEYHDPLQAQTINALRHSRGVPDLLIFKSNLKYSGLAIEIKNGRDKVYLKNGKLKKDEHVQEQYDWIQYLKSEGWASGFGCSEEEIRHTIDKYMCLK